jgi:hypothetical protein
MHAPSSGSSERALLLRRCLSVREPTLSCSSSSSNKSYTNISTTHTFFIQEPVLGKFVTSLLIDLRKCVLSVLSAVMNWTIIIFMKL